MFASSASVVFLSTNSDGFTTLIIFIKLSGLVLGSLRNNIQSNAVKSCVIFERLFNNFCEVSEIGFLNCSNEVKIPTSSSFTNIFLSW